MRILFVHDTIGDLGGAEANVRLAANGLQQLGHQVALLHGHSSGTGEDRFHSIFEVCMDWTSMPTADAWRVARDWQPDVFMSTNWHDSTFSMTLSTVAFQPPE